METTLKILLVEDNPGDTFLIKFYLEESKTTKYEVSHVDYLSSALKLIAKKNFDIVLLDLNLPDSEGLESLRQLLALKPELIIIVLTGMTDEMMGINAVQAGANDFLIKGRFDGKVLNSAIRYAFERSNLKNKLDDASNLAAYYRAKCEDIQRIAGVGYWELDLNTSAMLWSDNLRKIIGADKKTKASIKTFLQSLTEKDQAKFKSQILSSKFSKSIITQLSLKNRKKVECTVEKVSAKKASQVLLKGVISLN